MTAQEMAGRLTHEERQGAEAVFKRIAPKLAVAPLMNGTCTVRKSDFARGLLRRCLRNTQPLRRWVAC